MRTLRLAGLVLLATCVTGTAHSQNELRVEKPTETCVKVNELRATLADKQRMFTEKHPMIIELRRELGQLLATAKRDNPSVPEAQLCPPTA